MRHRLLIAALLAGSMVSPAIAQDGDDRRAERMERRGGGDGFWRSRDAGGGMRQGEPERIERAERAPRPERQIEAQPQQRVDIPDRALRRAERIDDGGQRRQPPVMNAPEVVRQAPGDGNRGWRGNGGGNWNRNDARQAAAPGVPPTWQRRDRDGDGIPNARDRDRDGIRNARDRDRDGIPNARDRDRDGDGIPNARDRDRDNDGIRNRRDWDRNNDGRVDRRWDQNNNGVIDRRFDRNRDGVRNNDWNDRRYSGNNRNWNRDWRSDRRYDWQQHRYSNRTLFRQPRYYSPYGYNHRYQRFGIGIYLDSIFFGSRYHVSNPGQYRLPYAEWPYQWVRYYDDVLLVDTRTGYVVDTIYDFFW